MTLKCNVSLEGLYSFLGCGSKVKMLLFNVMDIHEHPSMAMILLTGLHKEAREALKLQEGAILPLVYQTL